MHTPSGPDPADAERPAKQFTDGGSQAELSALVDDLDSGRVASFFDQLDARADPVVAPAPSAVRGFRVRLELVGTEPSVWRRLDLPGDLTLPRLHDVIQEAMGWTNSHLHRFSTGDGFDAPWFLTQFDIEEGDDGVLEDDVRIDQLVADEGDELWYDYDFGDGWRHRLTVEAVADEAPAAVRCLSGALACPPEDCGGIGGHHELAEWVRAGCPHDAVPEPFETSADALGWLPDGWDPDRFDIDEVNAALEAALAEPVPVFGELSELAARLEAHGVRVLRRVLGRPGSHGTAEVTPAEAQRLVEPFRVLLDTMGDGVTLTKAGYLPPAVVREVAERTGIASWWIGSANREDLTPPVAELRDAARALGLVSLRKGVLSPTAAARKCRNDPLALWRLIVGRLPLGTQDWQRESGWVALAVIGSEAPAEEWSPEISELMLLLGWRSGDDLSAPSSHSPTRTVLDLLGGAFRSHWRVRETDPAIGATARAAIRRGAPTRDSLLPDC